jgi:hypothetical protein
MNLSLTFDGSPFGSEMNPVVNIFYADKNYIRSLLPGTAETVLFRIT